MVRKIGLSFECVQPSTNQDDLRWRFVSFYRLGSCFHFWCQVKIFLWTSLINCTVLNFGAKFFKVHQLISQLLKFWPILNKVLKTSNSEFLADFKSGFSFSVRLIPISARVLQSFEAFLNILTKRSHCEALQSGLFGSFSVVETRPRKLSCWVTLFNGRTERNVNILKTAKNF